MNDTATAQKLRAARSALAVSGRGVLFLAGWDMLKVVLSFLYSSEMQELRDLTIGSTKAAAAAGIITLVIILGLDAWLYLYVTLRAIAESHGRHKNNRYIVLSVMITVILAFEAVLPCVMLALGEGSMLSLSHIPLTIISFAAMMDLTINAIRTRKLTRKLAGKEPE